MRALVLVLLVALPGCLGAVEPSASTPAGSEAASETQVNRFLLDAPLPTGTTVSGNGDAEPYLVVDRLGRGLYVGSLQGVRVSVDGGATWSQPRKPTSAACDGHPLAQGEDGVLYTAMTCDTLEVAMSPSMAGTWRNTFLGADALPDRPWLLAPGRGEVVLLYHAAGSRTEACWRSTDHGRTFLERSLTGAPAAAGNAVMDDAGRAYYATGELSLRVVVPVEVATPLLVRWSSPCTGPVETLPLPKGSYGPFDPVGVTADGSSVFVAQSPRGGIDLVAFRGWDESTRKILRVSPPELLHNRHPAISVHGDEVALAWYGTEFEPSRAEGALPPSDFTPWNVYVARVRGFWSDAPEVRFDRLTSEPNYLGRLDNRDLLEYMGLDHDAAGNLHVAYGHWATKPEDPRERGIRYAKLDALPPP